MRILSGNEQLQEMLHCDTLHYYLEKLLEESYEWSRDGNETETADIFEYQYETEEKELDDGFFFCKWEG